MRTPRNLITAFPFAQTTTSPSGFNRHSRMNRWPGAVTAHSFARPSAEIKSSRSSVVMCPPGAHQGRRSRRLGSVSEPSCSAHPNEQLCCRPISTVAYSARLLSHRAISGRAALGAGLTLTQFGGYASATFYMENRPIRAIAMNGEPANTQHARQGGRNHAGLASRSVSANAGAAGWRRWTNRGEGAGRGTFFASG